VAGKEQARFISGKEKEGFMLVSESAGPPKKAQRNPELEKAIIDDPDSPDGYLVYGDWLTEHDDPLGEYIAVSAALAKSPGNEALEAKKKDLFTTHERVWLGDLCDLDDDEIEVAWRYGFLYSVRLGGEEWGEIDGADAYEKLRKLPTARFLRSLNCWVFEDEDGEPSYANVIKAMVKNGVPETLRELAFDVMQYQTSWTDLGDVSKLYPYLERLEELRVHVGKMKLGDIVLPNLRRFEVKTGGLSKANLKSVIGAKWPKLESLVLYFGDGEYGGDCAVEDLKAVFDGTNLQKVTHLALCNSSFEDDIAKAIPSANVTKQLRSLDLSKGVLSDAGAQALLDFADSLRHLERIDLSQNYVSGDMAEKLTSAFGERVDVSDQGDSEDQEDRYVQIAE
jgi:uncharacterized protein (TIGR02996 family)